MAGSAIASRLDRLSRPAKAGVVGGGYLAAMAIAIGAVAVHVALTSGPDRDASSGMHAFGDASLFVVAFGAAAAIPTAVALHLLRSHRGFWRLLSIAALVVCVTGVSAAVSVAAAGAPTHPGVWQLLAVPRVLVAPVCAALFALCAGLAPDRLDRGLLVAAAGTECVTALVAVVHWWPALGWPAAA